MSWQKEVTLLYEELWGRTASRDAFTFKGDSVNREKENIFEVNVPRELKSLNTLMKGEMVYKDFTLLLYFFFAIEFRRLVRLLPIAIKNILLSSKILLKKFIDLEYSETSEYSKSSKHFGTSEISDVSKYSTYIFVKWLFTFSHSGKK